MMCGATYHDRSRDSWYVTLQVCLDVSCTTIHVRGEIDDNECEEGDTGGRNVLTRVDRDGEDPLVAVPLRDLPRDHTVSLQRTRQSHG